MASQAAAANIIQDAVRSYARKRARSFSGAMRKRVSSKRWLVKPSTRIFKCARTLSTGQAGGTILMGTSLTGLPVFICGSNSGQTLQMDFAFDQTRFYIDGTQVMAVVTPAYTELGALFDKFRIDSVEIFYSNSMSFNGNNGATPSNLLPNIVYVVDTDDANTNTATEIQQYARCRNTQLGGVNTTGMQRLAVFRPEPNMNMFTGSSATGGAASAPKNLWLDCGTPTIKHYGFKMAIDQITPSTTIGATWCQINFQIRFHFAFKDIR